MQRLLVFTLCASLSLPAHQALAAPADDAQAHFEAAAERYAKEDYEGAAREFAIAYALEPGVDVMFAWAQAERLAGALDEAARLYERLLDDELSAKQREAVEELLAEVRSQQRSQPRPPLEPVEPLEPEDTGDEAPPPRAGPDGLGVALTSVGAGLALVGGGLLIAGGVRDGRVRQAQTHAEFASSFDPATGRGRGAVAFYASGGVALAVGLATVIGGAVRLARRRSPRAPVALSPWFGERGVGLTLRLPLGPGARRVRD